MPVYDTTQIASALDEGGYQALANVTSCTSLADGTTGYSYDPAGEVTGVTTNAGTASSSTANYNWDLNGNPNNAGDVIGTDNELLYDGTYCYRYDQEGDCIYKYAASSSGVSPEEATSRVTQYVWDAAGA